VKQLSRKEKAELIAAAMKVIGAQKGLSPEARRRGLEVLQQAYIKHSDSRS
jgi:DNA-binding phage protein